MGRDFLKLAGLMAGFVTVAYLDPAVGGELIFPELVQDGQFVKFQEVRYGKILESLIYRWTSLV